MSDWKDKYVQLSAQQQEEAEKCAENEKVLCRAIVRLTIAVHGLDKRLDPHLKSLQTAAKAGSASPAFQHRLTELSDALVKAGGEKGADVPDLLGRLVDSSPLKGKELKQLKKLYDRLADDPASANSEDLDQLLLLLAPPGSAEAVEPTADKGGMFGRLLGSGKKEEKAETQQPPPNQQLSDLLQRLDWPARLRDDVNNMKAGLEANTDKADAWLRVIESISKLFTGSYGQLEKDLDETERFLAVLNARLEELDGVLKRIDLVHGQSMESGKALREAVVKEVDGVHQDAHAAADLDNFKTQLNQRMDVIQDQVVEHVKQEQRRLSESTLESEQMRARMKSLEAESDKLRRSLAEAQSQATTDALTGLPNRGAFEKRLVEEVARWKRFGKPLCMLVWDIDHFKSINDNFGHQAGDKTLRVIGQLLSSKVRETDFVARYGGEEFVMMMPGTQAEHAGKVANAIREHIAKQQFKAGDKPIPITISCGYCEFHEGDKPEEVFKRADDALYVAKQNGRNRCEEG